VETFFMMKRSVSIGSANSDGFLGTPGYGGGQRVRMGWKDKRKPIGRAVFMKEYSALPGSLASLLGQQIFAISMFSMESTIRSDNFQRGSSLNQRVRYTWKDVAQRHHGPHIQHLRVLEGLSYYSVI
jgi:hypothetical protein